MILFIRQIARFGIGFLTLRSSNFPLRDFLTKQIVPALFVSLQLSQEEFCLPVLDAGLGQLGKPELGLEILILRLIKR
ncbi:MAG: hypothetical protein AB4038_01915 [Prochloraceae cyanobacterium]